MKSISVLSCLACIFLNTALPAAPPESSHSGHDHHAIKARTVDQQVQTATMQVKAQQTCPVMGGGIDKNFHIDFDGKRVFFCCEACVAAFKKDPEQYLKKLEALGEEAALTPAPEDYRIDAARKDSVINH